METSFCPRDIIGCTGSGTSTTGSSARTGGAGTAATGAAGFTLALLRAASSLALALLIANFFANSLDNAFDFSLAINAYFSLASSSFFFFSSVAISALKEASLSFLSTKTSLCFSISVMEPKPSKSSLSSSSSAACYNYLSAATAILVAAFYYTKLYKDYCFLSFLSFLSGTPAKVLMGIAVTFSVSLSRSSSMEPLLAGGFPYSSNPASSRAYF